MNAQRTLRRLVKLQERLCPQSDGSITYTELARMIWQRDRKVFQELVDEGHLLGLLVSRFEREDAARAGSRTNGGR